MLENKNIESKLDNEIENYEDSRNYISNKFMDLLEKGNYNWDLHDLFKFFEKSLDVQEIYIIPVNSAKRDFFYNCIDKRCLKFHNFFQIQEYSVLNWMIQEIKENKFIHISKDMKDIPFYNYLNSYFQDQGTKSLLIFPLSLNSNIDAFITFKHSFNLIELKEKFSEIYQIINLIHFIIQNKYNEYILKENREQYRLIVDNISDLILIIDADLEIKYLNKSALKSLSKTSMRNVIGKSILNFIHEDDKEIVQASLKKSFEKGFGKVEFMLKQEDDSHVVLRCLIKKFKDENEQEKLLMVCRDITEQRLAEERYRNLFDNSPNAILLINFYGNIVDSNKTVKKLFGYEKDFFIGKSIYEFPEIFLVDLKKYFKSIFTASFKDDFPEPIEIQIRTKNDEDIWVEIQASLIKQENRMLIQLLFKDITEKKKREFLEEQFKIKLENEVKKRTKELNDALKQQKLYLDQILKSSQFKTEFMATMSHELRTPLNAIIGFAELLLEGVYGPLNKDQEEFIKDIKASAEHQFEMVKHILDISKIESGQVTLNIQKFSLNSIINQVVSSLMPDINKKGLELEIKGLDDEKYIYADPIRFKEILLNLLTNAIKFTMEGQITLVVRETYNDWIFKVKDTGIGIARKDFPLIFKEFKRIDSPYVRSVPGTGLGLSLTKRLVELHGGEISFFSVLGSGSTFTFNIPKKLEELKEGY